jgi:hypothetical protein
LKFIGIPLGLIGIGISIYANFIRDRERQKENKGQALEQALLQRKQQQTLFFQARLQEATLDNEVAAARGTLLELEKDSKFFSTNQKYGQWMFARQLTKPQYLPWLYDAHLVHQQVPRSELEGASGMLWLISGDGSHAAHTNKFEYMRYLVEKLQKSALTKHAVKIDRFLYGRYSGVGFLTKGDDLRCTSLLVDVIAGVVFHNGQRSFIGDSVWVQPTSTVTISGCPTQGDVIGFQENENGELWEQIIFPDFSENNADFKAQEQRGIGENSSPTTPRQKD